MQVLILRFDAPLMSFGSVVVDHKNGTDAFPYRAMLTGLCANALGLVRANAEGHERLQHRLRYAARLDRKGTLLIDFHTVSFDARGPMASDLGWTTRGELEERKGGDASEGTHIRERHYWADSLVTVAITLDPSDEAPTINTLEQALGSPARPLFLGRKCCLPSEPVLVQRMEAASLCGALESVPRVPGRSDPGPMPAVWPRAEGFDETRTRQWPRVEDRDWRNEIHVGRRVLIEGQVNPPAFAETQGEVTT